MLIRCPTLKRALAPPVRSIWHPRLRPVPSTAVSTLRTKCHEFNRLINSPDEPLSFAASPVRRELQAYLVRSLRLPPRWLRRSPNIRKPQRAINSAATALYSKNRARARWSTVKSARRAGVNSGSRKPADARASAKTAILPRFLGAGRLKNERLATATAMLAAAAASILTKMAAIKVRQR